MGSDPDCVQGYRQRVSDESPPSRDEVGAAEVIAARSLATDLGMGLPSEHDLHSTVIAMRLCARLGVDAGTASQACTCGLAMSRRADRL